MKTVKATFVQGTADINGKEENIYAIQFADGTYKHDQLCDQISESAYRKLIIKNHPEYDFTPVEEVIEEETVLMTPEVEQLEASTGYQTKELTDAFEVEEVVFTESTHVPNPVFQLDKEQFPLATDANAKIHEYTCEFVKGKAYPEGQAPIKQSVPESVEQASNPLNNNPLNTNTMENQAQQSVPSQEETVSTPKVPFGKKAKYYTACTAAVGVRAVTAPTHFVLQTAADILQLSANGVRNTEAFCIDKLKVSKASREEIKAGIDHRTARIERIAMMPVTIPIGIVQGVRMAIKNPVMVEPTIATA